MIYHITNLKDWEKQRHSDTFIEESLESEGFIHCSTGEQVEATANRIFRGKTDLVVLWIDESRLEAKVVVENLEGGEVLYPHIYGPIEKAAVINVMPFDPNPDGSFTFTLESI